MKWPCSKSINHREVGEIFSNMLPRVITSSWPAWNHTSKPKSNNINSTAELSQRFSTRSFSRLIFRATPVQITDVNIDFHTFCSIFLCAKSSGNCCIGARLSSSLTSQIFLPLRFAGFSFIFRTYSHLCVHYSSSQPTPLCTMNHFFPNGYDNYHAGSLKIVFFLRFIFKTPKNKTLHTLKHSHFFITGPTCVSAPLQEQKKKRKTNKFSLCPSWPRGDLSSEKLSSFRSKQKNKSHQLSADHLNYFEKKNKENKNTPKNKELAIAPRRRVLAISCETPRAAQPTDGRA